MDTDDVPKDTPRDSKSSWQKNSSDYNYITKLTEIFEQDDIPKGFDDWTAKEQRDWLNRNIAKFLPNVPKSLLNLSLASFHRLNYDRPMEKLSQWMDMDKYRRGQAFVREYYTSIMIGQMLSFIYTLSFEDCLKPIILSEHAHTLYLGFKKYFFL